MSRINRGNAVVVCSGGLDSTVLLYYVRELGFDPYVLTFYYNQKHTIEIKHIEETAKKLGVFQTTLNVAIPTGGSSLTDLSVKVPKGDYSVETQKSTVVPNRNMIFLSIAAAWAISLGARNVYYAAHFNDKAVYADCTPQFVSAMNIVLHEGNDVPIGVMAPFINMTKAKIVEIGAKLKVPFKDTWSCYDPQYMYHVSNDVSKQTTMEHCGVCGTCRERKTAFQNAEIPDPTVYAR